MSHYRPISVKPNDPDEQIPEWAKSLAFKTSLTALAHPIEYAKVLIQIGHEPIAPKQTKTFFGKPALGLPSVFQYIGYIKRRDGFWGLYAGLAPRLVSVGVSAAVGDYVRRNFTVRLRQDTNPAPLEEDDEEEENGNLTPEARLWRMIERVVNSSIERLAVIVVTQPLHVIAIRSMAQFVGGENKYGLLSGFGEILKENGILGFWSGLIPRAVGEIALIALTDGITHAFNTYIVDDKQMKKYTKHIGSFIASSLCYPFHVVGNCMVVSKSGLAAGYPPCMPFYSSWTDCWRHLKSENQLKRGSSLLFRYYTGPQVVVGDKAMPLKGNLFR